MTLITSTTSELLKSFFFNMVLKIVYIYINVKKKKYLFTTTLQGNYGIFTLQRVPATNLVEGTRGEVKI